jgi:hypothetical protein
MNWKYATFSVEVDVSTNRMVSKQLDAAHEMRESWTRENKNKEKPKTTNTSQI